MTKIKMLACDNVYELEKMVNDFIKDKKVIDIKHTSVVYHFSRHFDAVFIYSLTAPPCQVPAFVSYLHIYGLFRM